MNRKLIAGLFALLFITSGVQTLAISKLQKNVGLSQAHVATMSSAQNNVGSSNQQAAVASALDSKDSTSTLTLDQYLQRKYPKDYQKRITSLNSKLNSFLVSNLHTEDKEELRRFLCWATGGTWVQVGPSKSCIYMQEVALLAIDDGDGASIATLLKNYVKINQETENAYFKMHHDLVDKDAAYKSVQQIFTTTGVDVQSFPTWLRRLLCKLMGGDWDSGSIYESGMNFNADICSYN